MKDPEKRRASQRRYDASAKARARHRRYNASEKGRTRNEHYEETHIRFRIGGETKRVLPRTPENEARVRAAEVHVAQRMADFLSRQRDEYREFVEAIEDAPRPGFDAAATLAAMMPFRLAGSADC